MDRSQRFSPEKNSPQALQLSKEIYKREERAFGNSPSPERLRFNKYIPELQSGSPSRIEELRKSDDFSMSNRIEKWESQESPQKRVASDMKYKIKKNDTLNAPKNWDLSFKPIYGATHLKEKYDFNNRSPITWLAKRDLIINASQNKKYQNSVIHSTDFTKIGNQLNGKKILKGMGYIKSNIFSS